MTAVQHQVIARNIATPHEGRPSIHDDSMAQKFGYTGALVPGIAVYAYMTHPVAERWGLGWLARGTMEVKNLRPAYDGETLTVACKFDGDRAEITATNKDGKVCAAGTATLPAKAPPLPAIADYPVLPLPEKPPQATPESLKVGASFGTKEVVVNDAAIDDFLDKASEKSALYRTERLLHPFALQQLTTWDWIYSHSADTPGIHVSGWTQHLGLVRSGDRLIGPGKITALYERNGHHYVDTEQVVIANGTTPVALVRRAVIYRPRVRAA
jgi:hypothetical protein